MGCRVTTTEGKSAMYDSVTDTAFGPVFDTEEEANAFIEWCFKKYDDPRIMGPKLMERTYGEWVKGPGSQWHE